MEAEANDNTVVHAQLLEYESFTETYHLASGLGRRRVAHTYILCRGSETSGNDMGVLMFEDPTIEEA